MFSGGLGHGQVEPGRRLGKSHLWAERPSLGLSAETDCAGTAWPAQTMGRWGRPQGLMIYRKEVSRLMLLTS